MHLSPRLTFGCEIIVNSASEHSCVIHLHGGVMSHLCDTIASLIHRDMSFVRFTTTTMHVQCDNRIQQTANHPLAAVPSVAASQFPRSSLDPNVSHLSRKGSLELRTASVLSEIHHNIRRNQQSIFELETVTCDLSRWWLCGQLELLPRRPSQ